MECQSELVLPHGEEKPRVEELSPLTKGRRILTLFVHCFRFVVAVVLLFVGLDYMYFLAPN